MIRFCLLLISSCLFVNLQAQELPAPHGCGYDHYVHYLDQAYPGFRAAADRVLERSAGSALEKDLEVYTIPVVVHIVWKDAEENLSDDLIQGVIDVLNEDFRRLNADADQVRPAFADVVGDPFIEFELAGVERVQTDALFELNLFAGELPDNVKQSAEGGSDAWNTDQFLNIWVCKIEGGSLLGYAYPPAGLDHWPAGANAPSPELDGVVIHHEVFRRTGTYTTQGFLGLEDVTVPVRGRTITHEVGHYLGLRHIWGDGLLSILGIPDCNADDGVSDTPNQGASSQFACDPEQNSCTEEGVDLPDMFENYMDYAAEDCLNSFTAGQIAIMRSVLENERNGLLGGVSDVIAVEDGGDFRVFPNPARDQLFVESQRPAAEPYQIRLIDPQGRFVSAPVSGRYADRRPVDISGLPAGLYALLITQGDKQYLQRVLVQ